MASTALQMVNRVLKNIGQSEVAGFATTDRSALALEHVNQAARSLFEENTWDWLVRHDGVLRLYASDTSNAYATITNTSYDDGNTYAKIGSSVFQVPTVKTSVMHYAVVTDDSKWSNTAFRVLGRNQTGSNAGYRLPLSWHTNISSAGVYDVHFPEYILPQNVATIESATHQETPISIEFLDPEQSFDRRFPDWHHTAGEPRVIAIGGTSYPTIVDDGATTPGSITDSDYGVRAFVWPTPDDDYIINYSYRLKPTALSDTTDTFTGGVPETAIDRIVDEATATMMLTVPQSDLQLGALNLRKADSRRDRLQKMHRPDKGRSFSMLSLDRVRTRRRWWRKDTYGSLDLDG